MFRREGGDEIASEMIKEAIGITACEWGEPPVLGMVSFVDADKVRRKRDPGRCYVRAGFKLVGKTQGGLWAFKMEPDVIRTLGVEMAPYWLRQEVLPLYADSC